MFTQEQLTVMMNIINNVSFKGTEAEAIAGLKEAIKQNLTQEKDEVETTQDGDQNGEGDTTTEEQTVEAGQ